MRASERATPHMRRVGPNSRGAGLCLTRESGSSRPSTGTLVSIVHFLVVVFFLSYILDGGGLFVRRSKRQQGRRLSAVTVGGSPKKKFRKFVIPMQNKVALHHSSAEQCKKTHGKAPYYSCEQLCSHLCSWARERVARTEYARHVRPRGRFATFSGSSQS